MSFTTDAFTTTLFSAYNKKTLEPAKETNS